jgi:hypothetical protein
MLLAGHMPRAAGEPQRAAGEPHRAGRYRSRIYRVEFGPEFGAELDTMNPARCSLMPKRHRVFGVRE